MKYMLGTFIQNCLPEGVLGDDLQAEQTGFPRGLDVSFDDVRLFIKVAIKRVLLVLYNHSKLGV